MPFNWQPLGALQGTVPNQMASFTPQNNEGLRVPWGKAMFNLPRFQMPGTNVNFSGAAPMPNMLGQMSFNITRQASSDPVQNIINDAWNPMSGSTINFGMGPSQQQQQAPKPAPQGLRAAMAPPANNADTSTRTLATGPTTTFSQQLAGAGVDPMSQFPLRQMGEYLTPPFALRTRMVRPTSQPPLGDVFI